ncbi:MAG: hypothetical protein HY331_09005 [Chloroflexi bacterium]|nr:hypothetical protein [Chloroflexota bacterium]
MQSVRSVGAHRPHLRNRRAIGTTVGLVVAGLALSWFVEAPAFWGLLALLVAGTAWGTVRLLRHGRRAHSLAYLAGFTTLPVLLSIGAALFLRFANSLAGLTVGLAIAGLLLAVVFAAEDRTVDPFDSRWHHARFILNLATYLTAFALFAAIYNSRVRSLMSATAITALAALLALDLFRASEGQLRRAALYAGVVGLLVGEATWGLNWWPISGLAGGLFLLLVFYALTGVVQHALAGRLTRRTVAEFALVALAGLTFLFSSQLWLR